MNKPSLNPCRDTLGVSWLRRVWFGSLTLGVLWLATWAWLARPLASWTEGWVGWWTGDAQASRPFWHMGLYLAHGAEITQVDGDAAIQHKRYTTGTTLGHWKGNSIPWSWAAWVRVETPTGLWPTNSLLLVRAHAPADFDWQLGLNAGFAYMDLNAKTAGAIGPHIRRHLPSTNRVEQQKWTHVVCTMEGNLTRLFINGALGTEYNGSRQYSPLFANFEILGAFLPEKINESADPYASTVNHDDIVLWDRAITPEEVASLASQGRGGWFRELRRAEWAKSVARWGIQIGGGFLSLLTLWTVGTWIAAHFFATSTFIPKTQLGTLISVIVVGISLSCAIAMVAFVNAKRNDEARFAEQLARMQEESDGLWEKLALFLSQARDWISMQRDLTPEAWNKWIHSNHFPHDFPGVIGVGFATQVRPEKIASHEAEWSEKYGFDYRVTPPDSNPRLSLSQELSGNSRLPIVLYCPAWLETNQWQTNQSVLGRDMLFVSAGERRWWAEGFRVADAISKTEVTSSSVERIAPEGWYGAPIDGLRLYVPWTDRIKADDNQALEPNDWRGLVFASVDLQALHQHRLEASPPLLGFRIFTGTMSGERLEPVLDTGNLIAETRERQDCYVHQTIWIPHYHHRLVVDAWSTPLFEAQSARRWVGWLVFGGVTITGLVTALLFVQVQAREHQGQVSEALRIANSELRAASREREKISRDLHDGSIQNLYALGLHLQRAHASIADEPHRAREELNESLIMLDHSIEELRQFILSSGIEHLDPQSTAHALEGFVNRLQKSTTAHLKLHQDPQANQINVETGIQLLNIVREAVSNAIRHGQATCIDIRLEAINDTSSTTLSLPQASNTWRLTVQDNGIGFDPNAVSGSGHGLGNVGARALEIGGISHIQSTRGKGTLVLVVFPDNRHCMQPA